MRVCIHTYIHACIFEYICVYVRGYIYGSKDLFSTALITSKGLNKSIVYTSKFISFTQMNHYLYNLTVKTSFR